MACLVFEPTITMPLIALMVYRGGRRRSTLADIREAAAISYWPP
jgi:uncharacterized protein (TIGR03382 family)